MGIKAMTKDIYAPGQGETIRIGQHTNSFSISLSDELLASLKMSRVRVSRSFHIYSLNQLGISLKTTKSDMLWAVWPV